MNTSAAATQANVTIATIRTWCRNGVITATKRANRWIIDEASLAWRIALSSLKARKEQTMVDLTATYTTTYTTTDLRTGEPTVITPVIKTRTTADGVTITSVRNLAPLLTDHIDAIADEGARLHTIEALRTASIAIRDTADEAREAGANWSDYGRLATSYQGTAELPVSAVLELAAAIRAHLA